MATGLPAPHELRSAAVADHATGFDVERDVAHRQPRLIAETPPRTRRNAARRGKLLAMPNDTRIAPALLPPRCVITCRNRGSVRSVDVVERGSDVVVGDALGGLAGARVAEAAGPQRDALQRRPAPRRAGSRAGDRPDRRNSSSRSRRASSWSTARRCAPCGRPLEWRSATSRSSSQPVRQRTRVWIVSMPTASRCRSPISTAGIGEVVQRAVLEAGFARRQDVRPAVDRGEVDRAAGKPRPRQPSPARRRGPAGIRRRSDSRTSCRKRSRRSPAAPLAGPGGWSGRRPRHRAARPTPLACACVDELERMLHSREVRLRRKREQIGLLRDPPPTAARRRRSRSIRSSGNVSGA